MPEMPEISRVTSRAGAEDLIGSVLSGMRELEAALGAETAQVRVGRIRDGLASEAKKGELAARYLRGLEAVKANAVALARFAPEAVDGPPTPVSAAPSRRTGSCSRPRALSPKG